MRGHTTIGQDEIVTNYQSFGKPEGAVHATRAHIPKTLAFRAISGEQLLTILGCWRVTRIPVFSMRGGSESRLKLEVLVHQYPAYDWNKWVRWMVGNGPTQTPLYPRHQFWRSRSTAITNRSIDHHHALHFVCVHGRMEQLIYSFCTSSSLQIPFFVRISSIEGNTEPPPLSQLLTTPSQRNIAANTK